VFLVAGWRDGYANPMLRMYTRLTAPKKLLMGPWVHQRPNFSVPGPNVDYLNEVCCFFAHWLRDEDTGLMKEPPVTAYMIEHVKPERTLSALPGRWRDDAEFPVAGTQEQVFYLQAGGHLALAEDLPSRSEAGGEGRREPYDEFEYVPTVGRANAFWSGGGISFYLAEDQRADEIMTTSPARTAAPWARSATAGPRPRRTGPAWRSRCRRRPGRRRPGQHRTEAHRTRDAQHEDRHGPGPVAGADPVS
jgi:predicted acyl esterase